MNKKDDDIFEMEDEEVELEDTVDISETSGP